jgi:hypothetical protein
MLLAAAMLVVMLRTMLILEKHNYTLTASSQLSLGGTQVTGLSVLAQLPNLERLYSQNTLAAGPKHGSAQRRHVPML